MFPYLPERTQVADKGIFAMPDWNRSYASFRLNFEQQGKRAKDLLRAARAGEPEALARFLQSPPKLAEAQYLIAKECATGKLGGTQATRRRDDTCA